MSGEGPTQMERMKAKNHQTRRSIFCLVFAFMFLLLLPCFLLLMSRSNSLMPDSVFMSMVFNSTPVFSTDSDINTDPLQPNFPPVIQSTVNNLEQHIQSTNNATDFEPRNWKGCSPDQAMLKVYMYDLPAEFHFGLLGWNGKRNEIWPDISRINDIPRYPGGLNLQHSVEYWLTLDLLSSNYPGINRPCSAVTVKNSSLAGMIFVPFFSSISYNRHSNLYGNEKVSRNKVLQQKLVKFLLVREEWKRNGGKDHVIIAHHPNSLLDVRKKLRSATFVLADFGRYPVEVANIKKDIVAPYKHVVHSIGNDSAPFNRRPILAYFQGAIYRKDDGMIRQRLYHLLKDEKDVHFSFGTAQGDGIRGAGRGMASSKFCLNIAGDTPSSNRLFDAIASNCVPVIISDDIELPFEDVLDYREFCIFVRSSDAVKKGFLVKLLRGIYWDEWTRMWEKLKQIAHRFEYQFPSQSGDAVQMIWEAIFRKMKVRNSVSLTLHRDNRYNRAWFMSRGY